MRYLNNIIFIIAIPVLSGCVATKILTAPIRVAGTVVETAVDATTQTQSEREEDLGRRVLKERKNEYKRCKKAAENSRERRNCKDAYEADE